MAGPPKRRIPDEWLVYALSAGPLPDRLRACGAVLRVVRVGPFAVIVGPPPAETSIEKTLRRQHAIVLELARRVDPLLPARFGSRVSMARLEAVLRSSTEVVMKALEHVRGCQQMTVRLVGPPPRAQAPLHPPSSGTAYLAHRRAATLAIPREAAPLERALRRFAVETRVQPGRGAVRVTFFHLVRRGHVSRYRMAFESAAPAVSPLRAVLTGPWPPFAFAPELTA